MRTTASLSNGRQRLVSALGQTLRTHKGNCAFRSNKLCALYSGAGNAVLLCRADLFRVDVA